MASECTVLITGAAGLFGRILRAHWGDRYQLRLSDVRAIEDLAPHEEFIAADIQYALDLLDRILGKNFEDDLLNQIFQEFCIGK